MPGLTPWHGWADPASNMFLQNTGCLGSPHGMGGQNLQATCSFKTQDAWAHPMAWVGRSCKQHVPSKHTMPGLTQWHGSTSQTTGILEKRNLHVQTVCSLLVHLNMNIYILCAMAYDKLAKHPLHPADTLTQNTT